MECIPVSGWRDPDQRCRLTQQHEADAVAFPLGRTDERVARALNEGRTVRTGAASASAIARARGMKPSEPTMRRAMLVWNGLRAVFMRRVMPQGD